MKRVITVAALLLGMSFVSAQETYPYVSSETEIYYDPPVISEEVWIETDQGPHLLQPGEICRRNEFGVIQCHNGNIPRIATGFLSWAPINVPNTPKPPHRFCARSANEALSWFTQNVRSTNINKIIESFSWQGLSEQHVDQMVEQIMLLDARGALEESYVEQWTGTQDQLDTVPTHIKWATLDNMIHLTVIENQECWFMRFAQAPDDLVEVSALEFDAGL